MLTYFVGCHWGQTFIAALRNNFILIYQVFDEYIIFPQLEHEAKIFNLLKIIFLVKPQWPSQSVYLPHTLPQVCLPPMIEKVSGEKAQLPCWLSRGLQLFHHQYIIQNIGTGGPS